MASKAEQIVSRSLRTILDGVPNGADVSDTDALKDVLAGLERFIPEILGEVYPGWLGGGLDGLIPCFFRKSGERQVEIFGLCILIDDQTLTPIHLHLQVSARSDKVSWLECRLGEKGKNGMVRVPYDCLSRASKRLHTLESKDVIDWVYKVTFGPKQP